MKKIDITNLSFEDKLVLFKELVDNLDIVLEAAYGEEAYLTTKGIIVENGIIRVWTGICTG